MKLYEMTATQLAEGIKKKEFSAADVTESVLGRIDATEERVGAYLSVDAEGALQKAKEVDGKVAKGEATSPLAGVPLAIKDNICTHGVATTCASKMLENFVPPYDATVIEKLKAGDMVFLGKANMDEFAMGSSCENSYFKKTHNPHDLGRVPGGSSGGSAAAVASGEAPLALGSDTGGSIRQPSSFCGIIGLKPTYGSVSRYGLVAFASSLDQIGPMGRSVEDVAKLYQLLCGRDEKDATSAVHTYPDFAASLGGNVKGLRIGIPKEYFGPGISAEVKEAVMAAAKEFEKNGAQLREISLAGTDYALSAYYVISSAEASSNLARFDGVKYGFRAKEYDGLIDLYEESRSQGFGDEVQRRIMLGTYVLSSGYYDAYYKRAKLLQQRIAGEFSQAFETCDVILTPTAPMTAFKLGELVDDPVTMYASDICTVTVNIAGLPALSLPVGMGKGDLPIGMQLIGPKFSEDVLFRTARFYEELKGGLCAIPEL